MFGNGFKKRILVFFSVFALILFAYLVSFSFGLDLGLWIEGIAASIMNVTIVPLCRGIASIIPSMTIAAMFDGAAGFFSATFVAVISAAFLVALLCAILVSVVPRIREKKEQHAEKLAEEADKSLSTARTQDIDCQLAG